jgi:epoxyqueuosine reductase
MPISISERVEKAIMPATGAIEREKAAGNTRASLRARLEERARALGFDALRVTRPDAIGPAGDRLVAFLEQGRHGTMDWMATNVDRRRDPRALWPEARSVIILTMSYAPDEDPMHALADPAIGVVSVYARRSDYHDVMKGKLKELAGILERETGAPVKVFVDTAPLMEKPLAEAAGIGWQGKQTMLVSREGGTWLFLGAILAAAEFDPDPPETDHCGSCTRCLDVCPTRAFPAPYQLDARRCIAYLTIEHKGHIAAEFREPIGNRIFGCDDCLSVCPWNKFAGTAREAKLHVRAETENPPLEDLLTLDDAAFRARFVRNCLIAAGNARDPSLLPFVTPLLSDPSEIVRAMAVWALRRLAPEADVLAARAHHLATETDPDVRSEWDAHA